MHRILVVYWQTRSTYTLLGGPVNTPSIVAIISLTLSTLTSFNFPQFSTFSFVYDGTYP